MRLFKPPSETAEVGRDAQGKAMDRRVRFTDVYIKRDGRWQVWATQGTTIP